MPIDRLIDKIMILADIVNWWIDSPDAEENAEDIMKLEKEL